MAVLTPFLTGTALVNTDDYARAVEVQQGSAAYTLRHLVLTLVFLAVLTGLAAASGSVRDSVHERAADQQIIRNSEAAVSP